MVKAAEGSVIVDTSLGKVEYLDHGDGPPVLFVHGSPGGCDQGAVMTEFLVAQGFRAISISRPGYLGTPLTDALATPDQQAELEVALMDALGIGTYGVMCWSGGGPSSYRMTAEHPDRVSALVVLAGVSTHYEFANGINSIEYSLLTGAIGSWVLKEMVKHAPKQVVGMVATEEGDLTKEQAHALTEHIWSDETKREFVMKVSATISGRHDGLKNDQKQFPALDDLGLASISTPTLLVHGTADSDVHLEQSEHALERVPGAEILRVENGTHLCMWTDPTSDEIQARVIAHLKG
jgi:pimeloyl-ACP methyl ester carboxylesterase